MTGASRETATLRTELETATLEAIEQLGPDGLIKAAIVKPFLGRGTHQATLYRWIDALLMSGKPGQVIIKQVKEAKAKAKRDARAVPDDVVGAVKASLPVIARIEDVTGGSTINVLERLAKVTDDVDMLIRHAKTEDGKVRNSRLLMQALGEMRKCLETSVKFFQAMRDASQTDRLHDAILDEIAKASPEMAEAVYRRIAELSEGWRG